MWFLKCKFLLTINTRNMSFKAAHLLGTYFNNDQLKLTSAAQDIDKKLNGKLVGLLNLLKPFKLKKTKVFYGLSEEYPCITFVGLGADNIAINLKEQLDEAKENVRLAIGCGINHLKDLEIEKLYVDPCNQAEASGESAHLSTYAFNELKTKTKEGMAKKKPEIIVLSAKDSDVAEFERGRIKAVCQNTARRLMELPANILTPENLTKEAQALLSTTPDVKVYVRDKKWIEDKKMGSFLSVGHGSVLPPFFLEMHYNKGPADQKPIVLVGKGITFDSGGISLKPSANMDEMRADMGGAACVIATVHGVAQLKLPVNLIGLTPITENMPSGSATHPGDVVVSMNGKTIQIDNTDAEGRLILADALTYAHEFNPRVILDMATLTGAMIIALGSAATGVFSSSDDHYNHLLEASKATGDRVWRLPLFAHYAKSMTDAHLADLNNLGSHGMAGKSCTAAAFLKEFVTCESFMHLDIAGVMMCKEEIPSYLCKGMSGRPTRTIIEYVKKLSEIK